MILDFHPSTQSRDCIVKAYRPPEDSADTTNQPTTFIGIAGADSREMVLLDQRYHESVRCSTDENER